MQQTPISRTRHNLRGRLNALKLCVSAFEVCETEDEMLEFLEMAERASEKVISAYDEMERAFDADGGWTSDEPAMTSENRK